MQKRACSSKSLSMLINGRRFTGTLRQGICGKNTFHSPRCMTEVPSHFPYLPADDLLIPLNARVNGDLRWISSSLRDPPRAALVGAVAESLLPTP